MITPVRIPETPVILNRPRTEVDSDSVSLTTSKTPSEKQKKSPSPPLSTGTIPSPGSEVDSMKDVPVATLVTTA